MQEFSLKQLEVFVTVASLGSFTRAAQTLYLTQSTVSAHIRTLERALGGPLFQRGIHRQSCLTWRGEAALPVAKEILERCCALKASVQPCGEGETLELAASTVPAQCLLPELMAGFSRRRPGCKFRLQKGDSTQVHCLLEQGKAGIGFVGSILEQDHYSYEPIFRDRLVVVTANTPRFRTLYEQGTLGRVLLREPMLLREPGSGTRQRFEAYLLQMEIDPSSLHIVAQIDQTDALLGAVAAGLGISVCSALAARDRLEQGRLLAFELETGGFCRNLYLAVRKERMLTPFELDFCQFVREKTLKLEEESI